MESAQYACEVNAVRVTVHVPGGPFSFELFPQPISAPRVLMKGCLDDQLSAAQKDHNLTNHSEANTQMHERAAITHALSIFLLGQCRIALDGALLLLALKRSNWRRVKFCNMESLMGTSRMLP